MKRLLSVVLTVLMATLSTPIVGAEINNPGYFRLNTNPENPNRQPDWETEEGVVLSKDSPTITIGGGGGKQSTGKLPAGVLVIVNKKTGEASWVAICGNSHLLPKGWIPEGKKITPGIYDKTCYEMKEIIIRLDRLQVGIDDLLTRPISLTGEEVKAIVKEAMPKTKERVPSKCRTGCKILIGIGAALVIGGSIVLASGGGGHDTKQGNGNTIP